ncbi:MerR family transcriptional regulator [Tsukamurella sp. 8F]|uniref:transcriptional regulator FtsR n=1 Tax=unclassified Tsukamurella TaxID=2633480 RepID=UPI0023B8D384|nr:MULTISPECIES: MerR family transcriptional regulator [unclassified Tsukamurella]MDF0529121.1 MerR family transcriptional regulator [Tsukamurella sp. 8J]MDF0588129.1 MerR family transcriptional regulator [Tsukamurella sp. 8F]
MSIGSVLEQLRAEFPDVTISKIRFLESEGLVTPGRSPSGYRRFSTKDCERLRYVLTAQRDYYLPLKIIKEQLEAHDRGDHVEGPAPRAPRSLASVPSASAGDFLARRQTRISRADLIDRAGCDDAFLRELERSALVAPGKAGFFDEDSVQLVVAAKSLAEYGFEARHLRAFKTSADREAGLIAQIANPIARGGEGASERAAELIRELAALSVAFHTQLVKAAVKDAVR